MELLKLLVILSSIALACSWSTRDGTKYSGEDYYVGNWTTSGVNYTNWTPSEVVYSGSRLTFTVSGGEYVALVSEDDFDSCQWKIPKNPFFPDSIYNFTILPLEGVNYIISSNEDKCKAGLKLKISVTQPPVYTPKTYTVGDDEGWSTGVDYTQWTRNKHFYFGDIFRFVFNASLHNVVEVGESAYTNCNESYTLPVIPRPELLENGSFAFKIVPPIGTHYFISSASGDCENGLKVELEIDPSYEAFEPSASPSKSPSASSSSGSRVWRPSSCFESLRIHYHISCGCGSFLM